MKTEPPEEEERTGLGVAARTPQGEVVTDLQLPGGTEVQDTLVVFLGRLLNVRVGGAVATGEEGSLEVRVMVRASGEEELTETEARLVRAGSPSVAWAGKARAREARG